VPFLVRWKGRLPAGKVYDPPVIQLDIHATALAAAGVQVEPGWQLDGVDLLPYLGDRKAGPPHAALFWRFGEQMAVRMGDWKLVRADRAADRPFGDIAPRPMLFHLGDDVGEKNDLAAARQEKARELYEAWRKWDAGLAPPAWLHHSLQKPPTKPYHPPK
jgi:arylsulfatase A-like enzyme